MKILVLGGTGFLGPSVVRQLDALGHDVTVFHRGKTRAELAPSVHVMHGDFDRLDEHASRFREIRPEVVVNMRSLTERDATNAVRAFRGVAGRIVSLSSQDVYLAYGRLKGTEPGPIEDTPLMETSRLRSVLYPYRDEPNYTRYEKILVEQVTLSEPELPGTVLRLPMIYGPRDNQHRLAPTLRRMDRGQRAIVLESGLAGWRWTRGYVEDVAAAVVAAVVNVRSVGRIYNAGAPKAESTAEWIRRIASTVDWRGELVLLPNKRLPESLRTDFDTSQNLVVDTSRIRHELGYRELVNPADAIRDAVQWERSHPAPETDVSRREDEEEAQVLAQL